MKSFSFSVSLVRAWLRGRITIDDSLVHFSLPHTIFWIIPLGIHRESVPLKNISSVRDSFSVSTSQVIIGIVVMCFTLFDITHEHGAFFIFFLFFFGIALVLDTFRVIIVVEKSGQPLAIRLPFYEMNKARQITATLRQ